MSWSSADRSPDGAGRPRRHVRAGGHAQGERRLDSFDDRIVSLYARRMTVCEIRGHLEELYGVAVSPDLISRVTDAALKEMRE